MSRLPDIIIPYEPACYDGDCEDIFVYLRPETNGITVESLLLQVIQNNPLYRDQIQLIYLANIPGDFIVQHKIIEKHYSCRLSYAVNGVRYFTNHMKQRFQEFFGELPDPNRVVGAFDALNRLNINKNDLFHLWVPQDHMLTISGQTIKKYKDFYIVNYDIPEILHKNNAKTDIAVMLFRTPPDYELFNSLISDMEIVLKDKGIISPKVPPSHTFHYSKSPFEQLLDARGYLYRGSNEPWSIDEISFGSYLESRGLSREEISFLLDNPIILFDDKKHGIVEDNLIHYTSRQTYQQAYEALKSIVAHQIVR